MILALVVKDRKGEYSQLFEDLRKKGFSKVRVDGHVRDLSEDMVLIKTNKHTIDLVVDRLILDKSVIPANAGIQLKKSGSELDSRLRGNDKKNDQSKNITQKNNIYSRLSQSIETALKFGEG